MADIAATPKLDDLDRMILELLQENGRISNADLARAINLSAPATHARIRRLEQEGIVDRYVALLDREQVGYNMLCFVRVSLEKHHIDQVQTFRAAVQKMPEVLECYFVTGDADYLLKVAVRNREDLEQFLVDRLTPTPGVARVYTSLVLTEVKSTTALPLE
ncbi:MAG: Lrp/AsnC family transcriptional regulator [Caldilineales bacterium]|nr:Lrp/AsnC family transcriptional regulator [Caldilineales bacterium]